MNRLLVSFRNHWFLVLIISVILIVALVAMFTLLSANWRYVPIQPIEYTIDTSIQGIKRELLVNATIQATAMWSEQNSELSFIMTNKPDVLQITASMPCHVALAAKIIDASGKRMNAFVECPIWDTDTTDCTIYIQEDAILEQPVERTNILAHELGHIFGLSHYPDARKNHLMGADGLKLPLGLSYDTKGYVVPERLQQP